MKPALMLFLVPLALVPVAFADIAQQRRSSVRKSQQSQRTDAARGITYTHFTLTGKYLNRQIQFQSFDVKDPALYRIRISDRKWDLVSMGNRRVGSNIRGPAKFWGQVTVTFGF